MTHNCANVPLTYQVQTGEVSMTLPKRRKSGLRRRARRGPGRPAIFRKRVQVTFQLEREEASAITRLARKDDVPVSHYLRELVRAHLSRRRPR